MPDILESANLTTLLRDPTIGPAAKLAYLWMWRALEGRAGQVACTAATVAAEIGRSVQTARRALNELKQAGLVRVAHRDGRGELLLDVYNPSPGEAWDEETPDDGQLRFDFEGAGREGASAKMESKMVVSPSSRNDDCPKPSRDDRGDSAKMDSKMVVSPSARSDAHPSSGPDTTKMESKMDVSRMSATELMLYRRQTRLLSAHVPAHAHNPQENINTTNQPTPRTKEQESGLGVVQEGGSGLGTRDSGCQRAPSHQSLAPSPEPGPRPMGDVLPEAIQQALDAAEGPGKQAARLERLILGDVPELRRVSELADGTRMDGMHAARMAIEMVVDHGVPEADLLRVLRAVQTKRASGDLRSPGAFFRWAIAKLAARHGCPARASPAGAR